MSHRGRSVACIGLKLLTDQTLPSRCFARTYDGMGICYGHSEGGVRSMRILHERRVDGMVSYLDASEIPAFVVMEWVEGPNLGEAVTSRYIGGWSEILRIGSELAGILREAHFLPERVLHRDLRPSNIMLADYYTDPDDWKVVVLDFDLSWHRDAFERSVLHTTAAGYLAPEQIRPMAGASTRHAAVDSFGLGMTLLYLCTKEDPLPDQHRHEGWRSLVQRSCESVGTVEWRSMPSRFGRLIIGATQDTQAARWDMSEIGREIDQLRAALASPDSVETVELLAEEVAARSASMTGYEWDEDSVRAVHTVPTGLDLVLGARPTDDALVFECKWGNTGTADRQSLARYVAPAVSTAADQLRRAGWTVESQESEWQTLRIVASLDAAAVTGRIDEHAGVLDRATAPIARLGSR